MIIDKRTRLNSIYYNTTYVQKLDYDERFYKLATECGNIYSKALVFFRKVLRKKGIWLSYESIARYIETTIARKLLHSQTYQGAYQQLFKNINSYLAGLKDYNINPEKYNGKPRLPKRRKFFQEIQFKSSAIRYKEGYLILSLAKGNEPIKIKWSNNISIPKFCKIKWNKSYRYWQLEATIEQIKSNIVSGNEVMSGDLGVKRIITTYDGNKTTTYNGKEIKSLVQLRNKIESEFQTRFNLKYSQKRLKRGSRKWRKLMRAKGRIKSRISNKVKDILHKTSRTIVNDAISNGVKTIVIGECSNIHLETNCGKENQSIQQNPEQILRNYITYKFEGSGGKVVVIPEQYTSKTCPICGSINTPANRNYKCSKCNYSYDRDAVGAINIYYRYYGKEVSLDVKLSVVGGLTPPRGWKYHSRLPCRV